MKEAPHYKNKENLWVVITFVLLTSLYLIFKSERVGFGDALGFLITITKGYDFGTNATNHILYINSLSFFAHTIPFGALFDKAVIFSIIFSLATLYQLFRIIKMITGNILVGLASTIILGLSFTYWRQTEIIEVYTLNNFLFATMLYYMLQDYLEKKSNNIFIVSVVFGLSVLVHVQNILLIPFYLVYLYFIAGLNFKKILPAIFIFSAITIILFIIPLLWNTNSMLSIFFENKEFGDKATSLDFSIVLKGLVKSIGYFLYNFLFFSVLIIHGGYLLFKHDKKLFLWLALAFAPFWAFACRYDVPDNYVFFLQSYIVMAIVSGYSFNFFSKKYKRFSYLIPIQFISFPLIYFFVWQLSLHVPQLDSLSRNKAYKGGLKYLLWPGMENNGDLLLMSKEIYFTGKKPENFKEFEWNYNNALKYFKLRGYYNEKDEKLISDPSHNF